jgi:hypothetical protein
MDPERTKSENVLDVKISHSDSNINAARYTSLIPK